MTKIGITPRIFHYELGYGKVEITYEPAYGMKIADDATRFKQIVKEVSKQHGYFSSFMSLPVEHGFDSSAHFNHSLWNKDKRNVFYDSSDKNNLSQVAKYWIGGLQYHSKALACISAANPNCYNSLMTPSLSIPKTTAWGWDNRSLCYRVKNSEESSTYIESRMPGAGVNHYLCLAAHIYAGIDGIEKQIEVQTEAYLDNADDLVNEKVLPTGIELLPTTLAEALKFLNEDELFGEKFGSKFMKCFNATRNFEIEEYEKAKEKGKGWEWQMKQYYKYM